MADLLPRVGIGVDVHPVGKGRPLYLAALFWPDEDGLTGHSDGDVAAHAACTALLSAANLGDLGSQFGTDRPEWAGVSGAALLTESARLTAAAGFQIGNVAVQIIGNRPRISARRAETQQAMSSALAAGQAGLSATPPAGLRLAARARAL